VAALLALVEELQSARRLRVIRTERYRHRLTTDGRERRWEAVLAEASPVG
jgi:hypothetical protein